MDTYCHPSDGKPRSCAIAITRPPEIVSCLKIFHPKRDFLIILDSHARPSHPNGAAIVFCESSSTAAQYLADLFKVDDNLFSPDSGLQWQAELLAHVSGNFFVSSRRDLQMSLDAKTVLREANCSSLLEKTQVKELESQNRYKEEENKRLQKEVDQLEDQLKAARTENDRKQDEIKKLKDRVAQMEEDFKTVLYKKTHSSGSLTSNRKPTTAGSQTFYTKGGPSYSSRVSTFSSSLSKEAQSSGTKGKQSMSDHELAQLMQAEFDNEDRQLSAQMQQLSEMKQPTFDCGICFETYPLDDKTQLQGCKHLFCRDCIRNYVSSKLQERKYPLSCPACSANPGDGNPGSKSTLFYTQLY